MLNSTDERLITHFELATEGIATTGTGGADTLFAMGPRCLITSEPELCLPSDDPYFEVSLTDEFNSRGDYKGGCSLRA